MEDYIKGSHLSLNSRTDDSPCLEYVKLDGEWNHTPMFDKKCFQKVILLCIGKSKLAGEHAEKALDIYGRHIVGDSRLDEERAANAAAAPKEAKDFVLGPEEATRQESLRSGSSEGALRQWLSDRLDTLERQRHVDASALLDQVSRQHGVLEITRSRVGSTSEKLRSIGTPIDDSQLAVVAAEGGPLHLSVFLQELGVHCTLIRRLMPTFAAEVGRRKLEQWHGLDGDRPPLWIAWSLAAWRLYYTEADRELLCTVFEDPLTAQGLERLRTSCQPPRSDAAAIGRRRTGPYSRVLQGSSSSVSGESLQRFFGASALCAEGTSSTILEDRVGDSRPSLD